MPIFEVKVGDAVHYVDASTEQSAIHAVAKRDFSVRKLKQTEIIALAKNGPLSIADAERRSRAKKVRGAGPDLSVVSHVVSGGQE